MNYSETDCIKDTLEHITEVQKYLKVAINLLQNKTICSSNNNSTFAIIGLNFDGFVHTETSKKRVLNFIFKINNIFIDRILYHDKSKFSKTELPIFTSAISNLKTFTYGSKEYYSNLKSLETALKHHYENNRHHPEFFKEGYLGMTVIDMIEMICDWLASVKKHDDGDIYKSLEINQKRFGYSDTLYNIFKNTVQSIESNVLYDINLFTLLEITFIYLYNKRIVNRKLLNEVKLSKELHTILQNTQEYIISN